MTTINTETETVVKKILPYLERRGYDISSDLDFETAINTTDRYSKGYIDILVTLGKSKPTFLIEAKKISKTLTTKDRDQALSYANSAGINVPFVVVTNGVDIHCYNAKTKTKIQWDGETTEKIPTKEQLKLVIRTLKANSAETNIGISNDPSLPYRPGLPLRQLNALFYKCHSAIRKIEKNEENAFSDFSKLLFLKLLEEKADIEDDFSLPYSYRFHELAEKPASESDQVKDSILSMIASIVDKRAYGEVLQDKVKLKNPKAFHYIVKELSGVSFYDCSLDSKGAAFEYFVRATLKGKKLGQYFTPRELVQTMLALVGRKKIVNSVNSGATPKILDPACGTGGFLVFLMQESIAQLTEMFRNREITKATFELSKKKIKEKVFFGSDANEGVAASAKMNMIIAGDGHTNIQHEDSLARGAKNWSVTQPDCDLILTNPPFGTSETDSLSNDDWAQFDIRSGKGQYLFLQKMVKSLTPGSGEICTVIDEGVLNTESGGALRRWILQQCRLKAVVSLPNETFKPNKINVKSSLLYLEKRETPDLDLEDVYKVVVCKIDSLGYIGSGEKIRGFDFTRFFDEVSRDVLNQDGSSHRKGYNWEAFDVDAALLHADKTNRFDFKYWDTDTRSKIQALKDAGGILLKELNTLPTVRGSSPPAENYVDEEDGFAIVIKSGSNISRQGKILEEGADYIEKSIYDEFLEKAKTSGENLNLVQRGDVLLSSTGDGTLGKCAVYDSDKPAIADGHITIIRPDTSKVDPYYLCDYLRAGFGAVQVTRSFTGSTGMIELTPDQVDNIVVDLRDSKSAQAKLSRKIRTLEDRYLKTLDDAEEIQVEVARVLNDL
ncbi:N-6 DNA methylase [Pseudoduganella violacea]|uniref:site-specific DNA-methyltransferase (adenine-specific) n=1 Tax=Pseudoduganella violacea TaxID=1715466 RepID=A0A7W5B6R6_9BURK|nr:N-6 DNA methylase [Pseudoduganella violacea]MBB3117571.1 type I restriction enzyme M protein [Pseudoduganella violacea]